MNTTTKTFDLTARLLLALIFVVAGAGKLFAYAGTQGYMEAFGVPGALLPLVIAAELGLGILIALGFLTRPSAAALAAFSLVSALVFHLDFGDPTQQIQFLKNLAMAGGLVLLAVHGAGAWSVDARLSPAPARSTA